MINSSQFFLGIGPPKTATSWLYQALSKHPEIKLPPVKEIGYLWEKRFLPERNYASRFFSDHWYFRSRRRYITRSFREHLNDLLKMRINTKKLSWDLHYSLLPHTDSWYARLFDQHTMTGDITPKYCELEAADISEIRHQYGELKIIITVRDPIEREWSRAKMNLCKKPGRTPEEVPASEWISHFDDPRQSVANDYCALYERWSRSFGEENVHLTFYDEIQRDGWPVFHTLCRFLGVDQLTDEFREHVIQPANVGIKAAIPRVYEEYLLAKHEAHIMSFAKRFPDYEYPLKWLETHSQASSASQVEVQEP